MAAGRALRTDPRASWDEAADGLVDAMAGLLLAPSVPRTGRTPTEERA
jgi:hypothetical protein